MSRTYKDRPLWVKKFDPTYEGYIDHDHRTGECVVEDLDTARRDAGGESRYKTYHHFRKCNKVEPVTVYCTRDNPLEPERWAWNQPRCWVGGYTRRLDPVLGWYLVGNKAKCHGHKTHIIHDEIDCSCDRWPEFPKVTCWAEIGAPHWKVSFSDTPPRWFVRENFHAPERRRARDELRNIAKEYNATGDLDEITDDYYSRPPRGSMKWDWC